MAAKKDTNPPKKKDKYRTRNWKQYNAFLKNRGSITFWFSHEVIEKWYSKESQNGPGRPKLYSDDAILCALIRAVFHCKLRQLQGFIESLVGGLDLNFKAIMGSSLCSKIWENQETEAMVKLQALNHMTELGMPDSFKVVN